MCVWERSNNRYHDFLSTNKVKLPEKSWPTCPTNKTSSLRISEHFSLKTVRKQQVTGKKSYSDTGKFTLIFIFTVDRTGVL